MDLIIIGLIKVLDNMISTAKNITTYKNKKLLTSLLVVLSQFLFYFLIKSVVSDDSMVTIAVVCLCSGVGTYISKFINDVAKRDATYTNILTCRCDDNITDLVSYLLSHKIEHIVFDSYNLDGEKNRTILVFARTKAESSLIDEFTQKSSVKFFRKVLK